MYGSIQTNASFATLSQGLLIAITAMLNGNILNSHVPPENVLGSLQISDGVAELVGSPPKSVQRGNWDWPRDASAAISISFNVKFPATDGIYKSFPGSDRA